MTSYLITGSSRGLGLSMATHLASLPSSEVGTVFATARSESDGLKDLISKSSGRVIYVKLETTSESSIAAAVASVEKVVGVKGLDVLINNAGIMNMTPDGVASMDDLEDTFTTNVVSVHLVTRSFLPLLGKGTLKKIVNISSTMGSISMSDRFHQGSAPAYKISKAALNMLTVQYSYDLGKEGYIVFAISPGWLKTDLGGNYADLPVDVGAKATLDKIIGARKEDNGTFMNIKVAGWETTGSSNQYDGINPPW